MLWSVLQHELYAELESYGQLYLYGYRGNFLVCPKLVLLWSVQLEFLPNSNSMVNLIFIAGCIAREQPAREGLVRVAAFFDTKWRRG